MLGIYATFLSLGFALGPWIFARVGSGLFDIATFPFPLNKGKYTPILRNDVPWIHSGFEEFPPELGFESRNHYVR